MPGGPRRAAGRRQAAGHADDQEQSKRDDEVREDAIDEAPRGAPTQQQQLPSEAGPSHSQLNEQQLSLFVEAFARSQAEANRKLIETLISASFANARSSTPTTADGFATTSSEPTASLGGNFSKCSARFDGEKQDVEEAFIDAVQVYKDCTHILLVGDAAVWWQGVKKDVRDWDDAISRLRAMYGIKCSAKYSQRSIRLLSAVKCLRVKYGL